MTQTIGENAGPPGAAASGQPAGSSHRRPATSSSPASAPGPQEHAIKPPAASTASQAACAGPTSSSRPSASDLSTRAAASLATDSIVNNCVAATATLWCAGSQAASEALGASAQASPRARSYPAGVEQTPSSLLQPRYAGPAAAAATCGARASPGAVNGQATQLPGERSAASSPGRSAEAHALLAGRPSPEKSARTGHCTPRNLSDAFREGAECVSPRRQLERSQGDRGGCEATEHTLQPDAATVDGAALSPATRPRRAKQPWSKHDAWEREPVGQAPAEALSDDGAAGTSPTAHKQRSQPAARKGSSAKRTPKRKSAGGAADDAVDTKPATHTRKSRRGGSARRRHKSGARRKAGKAQAEQEQEQDAGEVPASPEAQPALQEEADERSDDEAAGYASGASADDAPGLQWDREHPHAGKAARAAKRISAVFAAPVQSWEAGAGDPLLGGAFAAPLQGGGSAEDVQAAAAARERALHSAAQHGDVMLAARYVGLAEAVALTRRDAAVACGDLAAAAAHDIPGQCGDRDVGLAEHTAAASPEAAANGATAALSVLGRLPSTLYCNRASSILLPAEPGLPFGRLRVYTLPACVRQRRICRPAAWGRRRHQAAEPVVPRTHADVHARCSRRNAQDRKRRGPAQGVPRGDCQVPQRSLAHAA